MSQRLLFLICGQIYLKRQKYYTVLVRQTKLHTFSHCQESNNINEKQPQSLALL
jgi:hypothetical protein